MHNRVFIDLAAPNFPGVSGVRIWGRHAGIALQVLQGKAILPEQVELPP